MKKALVLCIALFIAGGVAFALDPAEGYWISVDDKTGKETAGWEFYQQDGKLYGRMLSVADYSQTEIATRCRDSYRNFPIPGKVNTMHVIGTPWIFNLSMDQTGRWSGGNIIDPQNGNMYLCRITFHPRDGNRYMEDTLEMRAEVVRGIGLSQFWRKASQEQAAGIR